MSDVLSAILAADVIRSAGVFFGGAVVGGGAIILHERAQHYKRELGDWGRTPQRAMYTLAVVNGLVLAFITTVLLSKWGEALTWRWPAAMAIFSLKALFFRDLRATGLEQERRALYGD